MKPEILVVDPWHPATIEALDREFVTHKLWLAADPKALPPPCARRERPHATWRFTPCHPHPLVCRPPDGTARRLRPASALPHNLPSPPLPHILYRCPSQAGNHL